MGTFTVHVHVINVKILPYARIVVQGIYEIFKADLKLIATELLLSPKGRYKCPKQHTKSTKKSHWWNMLKSRFENLSNLPQGDHVLKMEKIQKFTSLGTFCL